MSIKEFDEVSSDIDIVANFTLGGYRFASD